MATQVVCVMSLTPIKAREDKGSEIGLQARKIAFGDVEKACNRYLTPIKENLIKYFTLF